MNEKNSCQSGSCGAPQQGQKPDPELDERLLKERMNHVKHELLVLSGKGGVGKSTVSANLAVALSTQGLQVVGSL